jgi:2-polyprenyl-3-methyl-5-hydroxy-6-metoxy-1,4-benzoquinol methylase
MPPTSVSPPPSDRSSDHSSANAELAPAANTRRVDEALFVGEHYLGKPADATDAIVERRLRLVRRIADFCGTQRSLVDVGCGNGASMLALAPEMSSCVGIEVYPTHSDEFLHLQAAAGAAAANCRFEVVDIEQTAYPHRFDRAICFEVIEHLASEQSVSALATMLNPRGLAAISVPNKWWIFETHGARLPRFLGLPWNRVPLFSWLPTELHERYANARIYTKSRIRRVLERAGFRVVAMHYITAPLDVLPASPLKRWLQRWVFRGDTTRIPFLATSIFVHAERR